MMYRNAAKQIKLLRIKYDLTQEKLAEKLGVSTKYISVVETNAKKASLEFYKAVANFFKVTFDYLFIDILRQRFRLGCFLLFQFAQGYNAETR